MHVDLLEHGVLSEHDVREALPVQEVSDVEKHDVEAHESISEHFLSIAPGVIFRCRCSTMNRSSKIDLIEHPVLADFRHSLKRIYAAMDDAYDRAAKQYGFSCDGADKKYG